MVEKKYKESLCPFKMETINRLNNIPVVESGVRTASNAYESLKKRSRILNWSFETAESLVLAAVESVRPMARLVEGPVNKIDSIMCHGLDIVETRIPSVHLPPQMMYWNTKEYMSDHLVRPVVRRANSVKQIGTVVLDSRVSSYAAHRIDGAIDVADKYIEKYLPTEDEVDGLCVENEENNVGNRAVNTFHRGQRLSRKLKRRLTERTFAEARALKKQSKEAINILIYAAELLVTDPKLAYKKACELWDYLSKDEPENQAPPRTLEQLVILITRESARRLVHLVNFVSRSASKLPRSAILSVRVLIHQFIFIAESLLKMVIKDKNSVELQETNGLIERLQNNYEHLQQYAISYAEYLVSFLKKRSVETKVKSEITTIPATTESNQVQNNMNGIY